MAIKTEIVWHKASEELPEKSGLVLVCKAFPYSQFRGCVGYSAEHKKFNAHDGDVDGAEHAMDVDYWAQFPDIPEECHG